MSDGNKLLPLVESIDALAIEISKINETLRDLIKKLQEENDE
jgi:hypothetical protein